MNNRWYRGVTTGCTADRTTYFIAVENFEGETIAYHPGSAHAYVGQFLDFEIIRVDGRSTKWKAVNVQEIPRFVETIVDDEKNICVLVLDIVNVGEKYNNNAREVKRFAETQYLPEVWDTGYVERLEGISRSELLQMKVICKRIKQSGNAGAEWVITGLRQKQTGFKNKNDNEERFENGLGTSKRDRSTHTGFIWTDGILKNGRDELYIWRPNYSKDLVFPYSFRKNANRSDFYGRWVTFTVSREEQLDEFSDVQIVPDFIPTRQYRGRLEIEVSCSFNYEKWDKRSTPVLVSRFCGLIAAPTHILGKYNNMRNFTLNAWIASVCYDEDIEFLLSEKQESWEVDERPRSQRSGFGVREEFKQSENSQISNSGRRAFEQEKVQGPKSSVEELNDNIDFEDEDSEDEPVIAKPKNVQRNRLFENDERNERQNYGNQPSSSSKSYDEKEHRPNNCQSELERLRAEYAEMGKNGIQCPIELTNRICELMMQEVREKKKAESLNDDDTRSEASSDMRQKRKSATLEVLQSEIEKQRKVIDIIREMISDQDVCDAMKHYSEEATDELFNRICDL